LERPSRQSWTQPAAKKKARAHQRPLSLFNQDDAHPLSWKAARRRRTAEPAHLPEALTRSERRDKFGVSLSTSQSLPSLQPFNRSGKLNWQTGDNQSWHTRRLPELLDLDSSKIARRAVQPVSHTTTVAYDHHSMKRMAQNHLARHLP
jgi:hypothetical protein